MEMDIYALNDTDDAELKSGSNPLLSVSNGENDAIETDIFINMLTKLEIDLAYSSEKLVNLELYMTIASFGDNGFQESSDNEILEEDIEKALLIDLSFGYIHSEVTELDQFLHVLQAKISGAHQKVHPIKGQKAESNAVLPNRYLFGSSWKDLQEKVSEIKQQLAELHRSLSNIGPNSLYSLEDENSEGSGLDFDQRRLVLGMLEKSLASELNLKRQLLESKEREEEQKLKLILANEVISKMEMSAEIGLKRLLEAEYSSEMFLRFAKETMFRLQILQFNLQCSAQREGELKSELQHSLEQLKRKDYSFAEVQRSCEKMKQHSQDKETFEEKVKVLEKKLNELELKLQETSESYEASQEQLALMEDSVKSLREHVFMAESRAHSAESKLTALTEENMELREEVEFLKGGDGKEEEKGLLEKKVRDLEAQLQTTKASSDMLYDAIFDMEVLVEELKSKVTVAESMAERAKEESLVLAESNLELSKQISFLKSKGQKLEECLNEANRTKLAWGNDINNGTKLITNMVKQLATERERIQKQLSSLARENKILLHELRKMRKNSFKASKDCREDDKKESGSTGISRTTSSEEDLGETPISATSSNQVAVDEPSEQNKTDEAEAAGSSTSDGANAAIATDFPSCENERKHLHNKFYVFAAIFVLALSILGVINWRYMFAILSHQYVGHG